VARSSLRDTLGSTAYLKTICRINRRGVNLPPPN
jgi:hypothetical protein